MKEKRIKIYSLATTYPESYNSKKPKFVHLLNKELVKLGVDVTVIFPHSKKHLTNKTMDHVVLRRFRYLPTHYELNDLSIPDEIRKSRFGKIKIVFLTLSLFVFTIFECLKKRPDIIHGQWAFPCGYIAYLISKLFKTKYIVSVHGGETPLLKKFKFIQKLTVDSLNKSSWVVVNSNYTKDEYVKMRIK